MSQTRYGDRRVSSTPLHRHPSPPAGPGPHPPRPDAASRIAPDLFGPNREVVGSEGRAPRKPVARGEPPATGLACPSFSERFPSRPAGDRAACPVGLPRAGSGAVADPGGGTAPRARLGRARPRGGRLRRGRGPRDPPAPRARAAGRPGASSAFALPHGQRQPAPARPPGPSIASPAIRALSSSYGTPHTAALTRDDEEPARWAIRRASVHAQPVASRPRPGADRAGLVWRPRHGPPRDRPLRRWTSWRRRGPGAWGPAARRRRPRHRLPAGGAISGAAAPAGDSSARAKVSTSCASPVPISSSRASRHAWRRSSSPSAARITEMQ